MRATSCCFSVLFFFSILKQNGGEAREGCWLRFIQHGAEFLVTLLLLPLPADEPAPLELASSEGVRLGETARVSPSG